MAIPSFFLGRALGKKSGKGETKTVVKKVAAKSPATPAEPAMSEDDRRRKLQAAGVFNTPSSTTQEGSLY